MFDRAFFMFAYSAEEVEPLTIMHLEAIMLVAWLGYITETSHQAIAGVSFVFLCDNLPFVDTIKRGRSTLPEMAFLLEQLHFMQCCFSFDLQPEYVKSEDNPLADALSRLHLPLFYLRIRTLRGQSPSQLTQVDMATRITPLISTVRSLRLSSSDTVRTPKRTRTLE